MTRPKLKIKKGDTVVAIAGSDKGTEGKVLAVFPDTQKALVEGMKFIRKHTKPSETNPDGGIIEKEAPIHVSNLKVVSAAKD